MSDEQKLEKIEMAVFELKFLVEGLEGMAIERNKQIETRAITFCNIASRTLDMIQEIIKE